jgi:4a-hydroxytetrahydrobiopterin dehydratase
MYKKWGFSHIGSMSELAKKKCVPCTTGTPPLQGEDLKRLFGFLDEGWQLIEEKKLCKLFKFKDFKEALAFVNDIGKTAEEENHHPDLELAYGKVKVTLWTHKIGGLSESDFILADKCDVHYTSRQ